MTLWASPLRTLALLAAALPSLAMAQYKWVDESGQVVYSDRPPASARGEVKVMRGSVAVPMAAPGKSGADAAASTPRPMNATSDAVATADTAAKAERADKTEKTDKAEKPAAPQTLAERDAAFRKRQQERAEAERKAAEQAQRNAKLAQICDDRRTDLRTLESGARISRVEANGERAFLSDEEIARRRDQLTKALAEDCRK